MSYKDKEGYQERGKNKEKKKNFRVNNGECQTYKVQEYFSN